MSTATYLRMLLVVLYIGWLLYLSAKPIRRIVEKLSSRQLQEPVSDPSSYSPLMTHATNAVDFKREAERVD